MAIVENFFVANDIDSWTESSYDVIIAYSYTSDKKNYVFKAYNPVQFINRFTKDNNKWNAVIMPNGYIVCTKKELN